MEAEARPDSDSSVFIEAEVVNGLSAKRSVGTMKVYLHGGRRLRVKREGFDRDLFADLVVALDGLGRGGSELAIGNLAGSDSEEAMDARLRSVMENLWVVAIR
jgi:hypothetical protein